VAQGEVAMRLSNTGAYTYKLRMVSEAGLPSPEVEPHRKRENTTQNSSLALAWASPMGIYTHRIIVLLFPRWATRPTASFQGLSPHGGRAA